MDEVIKKLEVLSRIALGSKEKKRLEKDIKAILKYVEKIQSIDVEKVQPISHTLSLLNKWRRDIPGRKIKCLPEDLIKNFPQKEGRWLKVKSILTK